jgi:hypothetical protein
VDSISYGGWKDVAYTEAMLDEPIPEMTSAGYLFHDGKEAITLTHSIGNESVHDCIRIPKIAITKTTLLRKKPKG